MKKISLAIFCFISISTAVAQSKYSAGLPTAIIKFSPQHLIRGGLWISGEIFSENHKMSNQIGIEAVYGSSGPGKPDYGINKTSGFTFEYMFKYYPNKLRVEKKLSGDHIGGFYTGFFAQAGNYKQDVLYNKYNNGVFPPVDAKINNTISTTSFYPGFIIGKQQSLGESLYIDFFIGAGMRVSNSTLKIDDEDYGYDDSPGIFMFYRNGVLPKMGMTIGIGF